MVDIGIHDKHAPDFLRFTFEFAGSGIGLEGDIAHDLAEQGFAFVAELGVFYGSAGNLGYRFDAFDFFCPDLSDTAAVGIIDPAGTTGSD